MRPGRLSLGAMCVALLGLVALSPISGSAQHQVGWGPHFGSLIRPDTASHRTYFAVDVGLFSEVGKGRVHSKAFQRYNGVGVTVGVTQLSMVRTHAVPRSRSRERQRTWFVGAALIDDRPTNYLQNELLHDWLDQPPIPRGEVANGIQFSLGAEETHRARLHPALEAYGGGGVNMVWGLIAESYVQGGLTGRWAHAGLARGSYVEGGCTGRAGLVLGAEWFLMGELEGHYAPAYYMMQCRVGFDASTFWGGSGGLLLDAGLTRSSGLFLREPGGDSIWETLLGLRITVPRLNLALETWNDVVGGKDQGPTFGVGLSFYR